MTKQNRVRLFYSLLIILGAYYIAQSTGFYYMDEGAHFVNGRRLFEDARFGTMAWARLGRILFFAPISMLGHYAVKIYGFGLFLLIIQLTRKIAQKLEIPNDEYLILFLGLQPILFDVSFTCLAEVPALGLLMLSIYSYQQKRYASAMLFASLNFLFRTELYFFAGVLVLLFLYEKRIKECFIIVLPPLFWWAYDTIVTQDPWFLLTSFSKFSKMPKFIEGSEWYHYYINTPIMFGVIITILLIIGISKVKTVRDVKFRNLISFLFIYNYIFYMVSGWKYSHISPAIGDLRYMTANSGFFALGALLGFNYLHDKYAGGSEAKSYKSVVFVSVITILITLNVFVGVKPHCFSNYEKTIIAMVEKAHTLDANARIFSNSWVGRFTLNVPIENKFIISDFTDDTLKTANSGFLVWDKYTCESVLRESRMSIDSLLGKYPNIVKLDSAKVKHDSRYDPPYTSYLLKINPQK